MMSPENAFVDHRALLRQELHRPGQSQFFTGPDMTHLHSPAKSPGANPEERDAIPVLRVHVGLDLEHEAREPRIVGQQHAGRRHAWSRRRGQFDESIQKRLDAKVVHRAAEEHRRDLAAQKDRGVERVARALQQRNLVQQARAAGLSQGVTDQIVVE